MTPLKSLDPDFLKDSIIELRYISKTPFEIIVGLLYSKMTDLGYELSPSSVSEGSDPNTINLNLSYTFQKEPISCTILRRSVIFNFMGNYPKWDKYLESVTEIVKTFYQDELLTSFSRIGLRFINVFEEGSNVFENVNPAVSPIEIANYKTEKTRLTTEIIDDKHRIILNIGNGYPSTKKGKVVSLLDIDVIYEKEIIQNMEELLDCINSNHSKEKEVFETLMNKDFLKKYNASYTKE